jgi:hypothetical protein
VHECAHIEANRARHNCLPQLELQPKIQPNRATTLYVPLPVFSEDMVSGFRQRAKLLGKKLKHSEIKLLIAGL